MAIDPGSTTEIVDDAQPVADYFDVMADVAQRHWWYRARRRLLARLLAGRIDPGDAVLDVGCGTADTLQTLTSLGARTVVGTDLSRYVLALGAERLGRQTLVSARAESLPFSTASMSLVVGMDVLEHLDDDAAALGEMVRVARSGALVYLTAPAYQLLWSGHDVRAAHRRRYTARALRQVVERAGVEIERVTYFNSFLVPPAFLLRRTPLRRWAKDTDEETSMMHPVVDSILGFLSRIERALMARGIRIPFGLSVLVVGRVPSADRR